MRPLYEKPYDRIQQQLVARWFENKWGYTFVEAARLCHWDFDAYFDGKLRALVEVKCRSIHVDKFDTYIISQNKMNAIDKAAQDVDAKTILIVRWNDSTGWLHYSRPNNYEVRQGGRFDRGDSHDVEKVIHIPISEFKLTTNALGSTGIDTCGLN